MGHGHCNRLTRSSEGSWQISCHCRNLLKSVDIISICSPWWRRRSETNRMANHLKFSLIYRSFAWLVRSSPSPNLLWSFHSPLPSWQGLPGITPVPTSIFWYDFLRLVQGKGGGGGELPKVWIFCSLEPHGCGIIPANSIIPIRGSKRFLSLRFHLRS